jgi:hypothetical protein
MADLPDRRDEHNTNPTDSSSLPLASPGTYEMDDGTGEAMMARSGSRPSLPGTRAPMGETKVAAGPAKGIAKHTFGLMLLLCVVFLWTLSNFLGSVSTC